MPTATRTRSDQIEADPARDAELRREIADGLRAGGLASIEVAVSNGHVTLSGRVTSDYEKQTAVLSVRRVAGVARISTNLTVAVPRQKKTTTLDRATEVTSDLWAQLLGHLAEAPKPVWIIVALGLIMPMTMFSCSPAETRVAVHPVGGKVVFKGEPAAGAQVVLHPKGHTLPDKTVPSGRAGADGSFQIGTYETKDVAPPGDYVVTVTWNKVIKSEGGSGPGPNVLPKEYAATETSTLTFNVKDGQNTIPEIDIK